MRTLYLCRHAKSSWADPGQSDHERPLNERGLHDAPEMARRFSERGEQLDLIVASDANRALTTARCFANESRIGSDRFQLQPKLYHASIDMIMQVVAALPDSARSVMLFGHNPGFSEAVEYFASDGPGELPTCGLVRIDFPLDSWRATSRDLGTLVWFDYPKRIA
ncbi:MAG: histidine phosphatase family protein [Flavobacteriales bacterium]|nr:histidine phosphatase family protein [Flavobacteriales bacterium]